ncbi:MAG: hypothetical protein PHW73_00565 [Atribacterota bacterium]|nr:hypothetical protein [Atribacterota bacterium]
MKALTKFEKLLWIKLAICIFCLGGFMACVALREYSMIIFFGAIFGLCIIHFIIESKIDKSDQPVLGKTYIIKRIINDHQIEDSRGNIHEYSAGTKVRITGYIKDLPRLSEIDLKDNSNATE